MKKLLLSIGLLVLVASAVAVADDFVYHGSFLWNDVRAIADRGEYLFCAFHDGLGTVNLDLGFSKKKLYSKLEIEGGPRRVYMFDDLLAVENEAGTVVLVDIGDPADLVRLGSFAPGLEIFDLARVGDYVYVAVEYDGILRYDISNPNDIRYDDSSMAGIRVTRLKEYGSRLFALDDYNGILIYEPDTSGFGMPVAELLLPSQAVSFAVANDTVYAGIRPNGYMVGTVADIYHPHYLETRPSYIRGDYIAATSEGLVLANSLSGFELLYNVEGLPGELFPVTGIYGYPEIFNHGGRNYIAYPHDKRGFVVYDIDDPINIELEFPDFIYAYPGPITQVQFVNSRLHTVGINNWYEIYDLSNPDKPNRSGTMINPPYQPIGMCYKADTIFVADKTTNSIFPAVDPGFGDPFAVFPFFSVADSIERPQIIPDYFGDMDLIYFINEHRVNGSARNASVAVANLFRWSFPTGITVGVFDDTIFYHVTDKATLVTDKIDDDFVLVELARTDLPGKVNDMFKIDTLLYMASAGIRVYSVADPLAPTFLYADETIGTTYQFERDGSRLTCASRTGIHIYDIGSGLPQLLFSGGSSAREVSVVGQTIAASDSFSVKIYSLPISDADDQLPTAFSYQTPRLHGYPNPFNPEIKLVLENFGNVPRLLNLDVFDILGRRVRRLPVAVSYNQRAEVSWDGRDEDGQALPSGMYLFRAGDQSEQAVFKAVLLK